MPENILFSQMTVNDWNKYIVRWLYAFYMFKKILDNYLVKGGYT